jgi:O-antigen/teichoic acid export membrane protein
VAILILGFSGDTILGWFGVDFTAGYTSLLLFVGGQLIITAVGPVDLLLNLTRHQDRCMVAFSSALPIALILNLLLVATFGMLGAAATVLCTTAFWNLWLHYIVVKMLGIHPSILGTFTPANPS